MEFMDSFFSVLAGMGDNIDAIVGEQGAAFAKFGLTTIFPSLAILMLAIPVINHLITDSGFVDLVSDFIRSLFFVMAIFLILTNWGQVASALKQANKEITQVSASALSKGTASDPVELAANKIYPNIKKLFEIVAGNVPVKEMSDDAITRLKSLIAKEEEKDK